MSAANLKKQFSGDYIGYFRKKPFIITTSLIILGAAYFWLPILFKTTYESPLSAQGGLSATAVAYNSPEVLPPPVVMHLPPPQAQKVIYMTSCVAGTPSFRKDLVELVETTELNSILIDIKDFSGTLSFFPEDESLKALVSDRCRAPDMKEFIETLHDKGIYVIGRITVFQDPYFAKLRPDLAVKKASDGSTWKDYKGISYMDPGSKEVWDHTVAIAKESYAIGFDELNFDYIRFPSDGPMSDIAFTWSGNRKKADVLEDFFLYLSSQLKPTDSTHSTSSGQAGSPQARPMLSADLFGMTTTNTDDLNIGQVLEKAAPYFDYIAPMVYPSHYPPRFNGWDNPNKYPYEVIKFSMDEAVKRFLATSTAVAMRGTEPLSTPKSGGDAATGQASTSQAVATKPSGPLLYPKEVWDKLKLRPWLQDFDYGGNYDIAEVKAQITAVYDAGLTSWMLWAPSNRYTKGALLPE